MLIDCAVRNERILRDYFDYYLRRHRAGNGQPPLASRMPKPVSQVAPPLSSRHYFSLSNAFRKQNEPKEDMPAANDEKLGESNQSEGRRASPEDLAEDHTWDSEVEEVALVRKVFPVASLRKRRQDVFNKLEIVRPSSLGLSTTDLPRLMSNWHSVSCTPSRRTNLQGLLQHLLTQGGKPLTRRRQTRMIITKRNDKGWRFYLDCLDVSLPISSMRRVATKTQYGMSVPSDSHGHRVSLMSCRLCIAYPASCLIHIKV